ncbi:hypothetical protein HJB81_25660 [Rhizobium sp. NZLR1]|nr:hypothetical protein [Rhizobium sp. NZLR8]MBX5167449.1 hypothetical protein [Rhizobium sp. NZLR4b]MBX5186270.1 hypothetical protein [Rhizobium sp. NZLR5]MBX5191934.1 hypothetical protein [Rhizobium sp. NZLR3b]MBX5198544.1 hypothetical protein [Rhizobium sp. NZLR10]MBX5204709.1 hypothetical protein [Rhizobium sp. NZLR1]MBX5210572.1 hypothetical protein [Rhizobium sp. NZLR11]
MRPNETELQMVMRHVRDGAAIVARQTALIKRLAGLPLPTRQAEDLLVLLERIQSEHILHLQRLGREVMAPTFEGKSNVQ